MYNFWHDRCWSYVQIAADGAAVRTRASCVLSVRITSFHSSRETRRTRPRASAAKLWCSTPSKFARLCSNTLVFERFGWPVSFLVSLRYGPHFR